MIEEEIIGSQSEETSQDEGSSMDDVYEAFGLEKPATKEEEKAEETDPAIDQKPEPKIIKVKHNKEEIDADVSDEKLPELVQRSLALDKERERKAELEKSLDRAAKLAGFNNHAEYIANLDKLEQQQQQKVQDEYTALRSELRTQAEDAGLDPDKVEQWLDNHPLMKEALKAKEERDTERSEREQQQVAQQHLSKWQALYQKYPDTGEDSTAFERGEAPTFFTAEMQSLVQRGYDPVHAYELAHKDKLQTQSKKATEQRVIKEQQLGLRSKVETTTVADNEPQVPKALEDAFEAFGLGKTAAKKYVK